MLQSILLILLMGFFGGQIANRIKIPALVGMIAVGILLKSAIAPEISSKAKVGA